METGSRPASIHCFQLIEIVDTEEKINAFLTVLDEMMGGGLVTPESAKVIRYQHQGKK
jgi:uncharacterized protein